MLWSFQLALPTLTQAKSMPCCRTDDSSSQLPWTCHSGVSCSRMPLRQPQFPRGGWKFGDSLKPRGDLLELSSWKVGLAQKVIQSRL